MLALLVTIVVTAVYGWIIERVAYKPLRNSIRLAPLISAIGISLILQNYAQISQGARNKACRQCSPGLHAVEAAPASSSAHLHQDLHCGRDRLLGMALLTYVIKYTKLGRMCAPPSKTARWPRSWGSTPTA